MNKVAKLTIATGISIGTMFGVVNIPSQDGNDVEAATTPYYKYQGNTGHDGSFILDSTFINALVYKNVTMNGHRIVQPQSNDGETFKNMNSYDQTFYFGNNHNDNYAASVKFPVKQKHISKSQIMNVYGNDYTIEETSNGKNYRFIVEGNLIIFTIVDNYVTNVNIGEDLE
ncbi:hypothetical protein MXL97_08145 [Mammaliicoccus fleurettii]|uniref:immunodominant staphylococcal antigen IsaB family protein n=1 Tax=Mammaliicoccus fleurettii TaxID=150056 RepID=UPI001C501C7E|nr:hypothetical protein [Mammaliicoccus fleurettii]MBW0764035.1 hypothetical protein [Mammaliicoccus fleurettii]MEB6201789.1 hypothetical protein [Mammaliicoccus fleurettii]